MGCKSLDISDVMVYGPKFEFDVKDKKSVSGFKVQCMQDGFMWICIKVNAIDVTSDGDMYALSQDDRIIIGDLKDGKEVVMCSFNIR